MLRGIGRLRAGGSFNPGSLFAGGEQGVWLDPSDFSTMFQDSAGTTPVTAVGQSVGKINDKSGRGNHATQGTAGSRPVLRQDASGFYYLEFDGTDDFLSASVNLSGTNKATAWVGVRKASDAAFGCVCELTANAGSNNGGFYIGAPGSAAADYGFAVRGTVGAAARNSTTYTSPISNVLSVELDTAAASTALQVKPRVNGATGTVTDAVGPTTAGNLANSTLYIGRRAGTSSPLNGRIYQLIVRGSISTSTEVSAMERLVGGRMGIPL